MNIVDKFYKISCFKFQKIIRHLVIKMIDRSIIGDDKASTLANSAIALVGAKNGFADGSSGGFRGDSGVDFASIHPNATTSTLFRGISTCVRAASTWYLAASNLFRGVITLYLPASTLVLYASTCVLYASTLFRATIPLYFLASTLFHDTSTCASEKIHPVFYKRDMNFIMSEQIAVPIWRGS